MVRGTCTLYSVCVLVAIAHKYKCCLIFFGFVVVWDVIEQGITVSVAAFMKMVLPEQYILPLVDQLHVHAHMYSTFCGVLSHVEHFYKSTVHVPS